MWARRLLIEGELEAINPVHVGSGHFEPRPDLLPEEERARLASPDDAPNLALLARDVDERPYIPGSTIKGVLRALSRAAGDVSKEAEDSLFGTIKAETGAGYPGRLMPYAATFVTTDASGALPHEENGVYVAARVKIDEDSGTAEHNKLYYEEMIAPHAKFRIRMRYFPGNDDDGGDIATTLFWRVLKTLSRDDGVQFGKGRSDGHGFLRLDGETLTSHEEILDATGAMRANAIDPATVLNSCQPLETDRAEFSFIFSCDGPFFVNDWSHTPQTGANGEPQGPQLKAQRRDDTTAHLPGTSLMGVLRTRAQWLKGLQECREKRVAVLGSADARGPSCPVRRLFGDEGWGALLQLTKLEAQPAQTKPLTSVRLDRFSGAPMDGALFTVEAFVGPRFNVSFRLDERRATSEDEAFARHLFTDLRNNGLMIGAVANRGFGWFDVAEVD